MDLLSEGLGLHCGWTDQGSESCSRTPRNYFRGLNNNTNLRKGEITPLKKILLNVSKV
jgi:hypothetical protein